MGEDRCDVGEKPWISYRKQSAILLASAVIMFGLTYLCEPYPMFRPAVSKFIYNIYYFIV